MPAEAFGELIAGMEDVLAFERGRRRGFTVHGGRDLKVIPEGQVHSTLVRRGLRQFAAAYGLDVAAVRDWEQGRRQSERAQVLLERIDREPETVRRILAG